MAASSGINIATLFLTVVPEFDGIEGKVGAAFGAPMEKEASESGKKTGKKFGASFGDNVKTSLAALGLGAMVADAFGNAMVAEGATKKMTAAMGLTPEESAAYGEIAGSLYANAYGTSMEDVTKGIDAVASTLVKTGKMGEDQLEGITGKAMSLAEAFDVDVAEAANSAGILMQSGLAKDATEAFDLITNAGQKVPAQMRGEIFPVMDEYSKHFSALGMDGKTAMGIMTMASQDGAIGMDKAGDAIKEFQIRSTDMSKATAAAYEALGLNTQEMTNKILGGGAGASEAFGKIVHGLQEIDDPAAQSAAALALFGTPLEDIGVDKIPNFLGAIDPMGDAFDDVAGKAGELDAVMGGGAAASMEKFTRASETAMSGLASSMLPTLSAVLEKLMPIIEGMEPFAPVLFGVAGAFIALSIAMWAASLTPITLIIGGIMLGIAILAAGVIWLGQNWDTIWAGMSIVIGGFFNWVGELLGGFANWWNEIWGGFANGATDAWNGFSAGVKTIWDAFTGWFQPGLDVFFAITNTAWRLSVDTWSMIFGGFFNWIKGIWDGFVVWITPALQLFAGIWNAIWSAITGFVTAAWNGMIGWIVGIWTGFVAWISPALNLFAGIWNAVWGAVSGFVTQIWDGIVGAVRTRIDEVLGFVTGIGESMGSFFGDLIGTAYNWGSNIIQGLLDGLKSMGGQVGNFFSTLIPGWIIDPFKEALDINSPSRVFYEMGENTGDGYLNGAESKKDLIKASMESLVAIPETPRTSSTPATAGQAAAGTGDTINIHPSEGMDEVLLGEHISNNNRRKGRR